jgi:hypothetical protein
MVTAEQANFRGSFPCLATGGQWKKENNRGDHQRRAACRLHCAPCLISAYKLFHIAPPHLVVLNHFAFIEQKADRPARGCRPVFPYRFFLHHIYILAPNV